MTSNAPPIVKLAERLVVEIEIVVRGFARYHKYTTGSELRSAARKVLWCAYRAYRDHATRGDWLERLVHAVDELKLTVQIMKGIGAFRSFAQFEALARSVSDLGRQCGGWHKQHVKSLNRTTTSPGRAQILSAHGASSEAHR
jgi:hypothetical protein